MKTSVILSCIVLLSVGMSLLSACEDINELPPRDEAASANYKIPDPVLLNAEENAIVDSIRTEYETGISNPQN